MCHCASNALSSWLLIGIYFGDFLDMRPDMKTMRLTESNSHLSYLRDFRVEQCSLFQQHKCSQHRPYTCFHWHFKNQKRRRPALLPDGGFNYSADEYCGKYDESTGECADGEECVLLHRTAGDTERRYHLRYYKTGMCVHETDSRGLCVKNGAHCAFAHGTDDLRMPVFDRREQLEQQMEAASVASGEAGCASAGVMGNGVSGGVSNAPNSLDREHSLISEDPKWQDSSYVLANYKTEPCRKPPRLCRQGYACPHYHNPKDKRRSPIKYKYRSTPCPSVKVGDEWGDPANCETGAACQYCHSRTEQQFHPEIYKSTRCNDIQQSGYCPRAAFCAFAHVEQEIMTYRDIGGVGGGAGGAPALTNLADIVSSALMLDARHAAAAAASNNNNGSNNGLDVLLTDNTRPLLNARASLSEVSVCMSQHSAGAPGAPGIKSRTLSGPATSGVLMAGAGGSLCGGGGAPYNNSVPYPRRFDDKWPDAVFPTFSGRAPGCERDSEAEMLRRRLIEIDLDPDLDTMEKLRRKNGLFASAGVPLSSNLPAPASSTQLACIDNDDVSLRSAAAVAADSDSDDVMTRIDRQTELEERQMSLAAAVDTPAGSSLLGMLGHRTASLDEGVLGCSSSAFSFSAGTRPLTSANDDCDAGDSALFELLPSQVATGSGGASKPPTQTQVGFMTSLPPPPPPQTPTPSVVVTSQSQTAAIGVVDKDAELRRTRDEAAQCRAALTQCHALCDAWRNQTAECRRHASRLELTCGELQRQLASLQRQHQLFRSELHVLAPSASSSDLSQLPLSSLAALRSQLLADIERLDQAILSHTVEASNQSPSSASSGNAGGGGVTAGVTGVNSADAGVVGANRQAWIN